MNRPTDIVDLAAETALTEKYDLALFASGYESRCTYLPEKLDLNNFKKAKVFGFQDATSLKRRKLSDRHYKTKWHLDPAVVGRDIDSELDVIFRDLLADSGAANEPIKVLIDYSSMTRIWYASMINWFRFNRTKNDVFLDFNYSVGDYAATYPSEQRQSVVSQIISLPAMEGLSASRAASIAVLGLGFTPTAGLGVLERLQPQSIFSFYASPGARPEYARICRTSNKQLLEASNTVLELPMDSVNVTFKELCELLIPFVDSKQITFIPMGPKPHVLASILVGCRFHQVACLYARMSKTSLTDVRPYGPRILTRVIFS